MSLTAESGKPNLSLDVGPRDHTVQFYEGDEFLGEAVAEYVKAGLDAGEPALIIASADHGQSFGQALERRGVHVEHESAAGRLTFLDANEVLSRISKQGSPQWHSFEREIGPLVESLCRASLDGRIRVYGEMVDLLLKAGHPDGAVELEEMWSRFPGSRSLSLLCGYSLADFRHEGDTHAFERICASHHHVLPTERYLTHADDGARLREVSLLQQRARALENEVTRRRALENSLREALAARQRLDDELRRQNDELSRAVRFSEMFVGMLGHDLRNPLSAITTAAQVLSRRAESERVAIPAKRITNSAMRMSRMIDQLLDFTRIRLGNGIPLERAPVDLADVVRAVVDELEFGLAERRIRLDSAGDLGGSWDADRLGQLASNLVGNAVAHGVPEQPVSVRLDGNRELVIFEVHNWGSMSEDALAGLFQPFANTAEKKLHRSGGFGLGLYISQQIVLAHSGTIDVSSSPAEGTRIAVTLPRTAPVESAGMGEGSSG